MRKFALGLASVGAFAAITIGLAGPAMASPDKVVPVVTMSTRRTSTPARWSDQSIVRCTSTTRAHPST